MDSLRDVFLSGEPFELEVTMRIAYDESDAKKLRAGTASGAHTVIELLTLLMASIETTTYRATSQDGELLYEQSGPSLWVSPDLVK